MSIAGEVSMMVRSARLGRWVMFRRMWSKWAYGLTHRTCRQCHGQKGLNMHANCYRCQWHNITKYWG